MKPVTTGLRNIAEAACRTRTSARYAGRGVEFYFDGNSEGRQYRKDVRAEERF